MRTRADEGGSGFRRRRRRSEEFDLDITPMIDVTFLLLVFFMVTSTMQGTPDQNVPVSDYGEMITTNDAVIVRIASPGGGAAPEVSIESVAESVESIGLEELADYVRARRNQIRRVIVKADRDVPHGLVRRVTRVVNEVEGLRFHVAVRDDAND